MGSLTIARESRCATCWSLGPEESLLPDPLLRSSWLEAKCIGQTPPLANSKIPPPPLALILEDVAVKEPPLLLARVLGWASRVLAPGP